MKEKKLLKQGLLSMLIAVILFVALEGISFLATDRSFHLIIPDSEVSENVSMEPEGIVSIADYRKTEKGLELTLQPAGAGQTVLTFPSPSEDESIEVYLQVDLLGIITNVENRDFAGADRTILLLALFMAALAVILWVNFARACRNLYFSYQTMFFGGFGIWVTTLAMEIMVRAIMILTDPMRYSTENYYVENFFVGLTGTGEWMILIMTIPLLLFAAFMVISSISLMKHESRKPANAMGMVLGIGMVLAEVGLVFLISLDFSVSGTVSLLWDHVIDILSSLLAILECLLVGAIICGIRAARHEPVYDKDFIIILGCKIKQDGTLYPLGRGRVDRALAFYQKQLARTGKQAILIPSGGKGSDETLSEGEAMKRYLLEQGVPEACVIAETRSANTYENMIFSHEIIEKRKKNARVAFSTTNFHVFRSGILAARAGFEFDGMGSKTKWYFWPNAFIREFFGLLAYCRKKIINLTIILLLVNICISCFVV